MLEFNLTASENGMAGAFVAMPSNSVTAAWYNPAQLGYKTDYTLALQVSPYNTWLFDGTNIHNYGFRAQHELTFLGKLVQLGISYQHSTFRFGDFEYSYRDNNELGYTTVEIQPFDQLNMISFGLGIPIAKGSHISFGYSLKNAKSDYTSKEQINADQLQFQKLNLNMHDWGLMLDVNVSELINWDSYLIKKNTLKARLGYTIRNIGDTHTEDDIKYFLPRSNRLGFSLTYSVPTLINNQPSDFIRLHFSRDVRDNSYSPTFLPSNTNLYENLLMGKSTNVIMVYNGVRVDLWESVEFSLGQYRFAGNDDGFVTTGVTLDSKGLKKAMLDDVYPIQKSFTFRLSSSVITHKILENAVMFSFEVGYLF